MKDQGYLSQSLRDSLLNLQVGLKDMTLKANARTPQEKEARYAVILGGVEGSQMYAKMWTEGQYDEVGDRNTSEPRLRLGLADQIFTAVRNGGVSVHEGAPPSDVLDYVIGQVDMLDPSLNIENTSELRSNPSSVEGS
jgi:hypothetical protein